MTDEFLSAVAFAAAKLVAARDRRVHYAELVGRAWEGAARAARKGLGRGQVAVAARNGAKDALRDEVRLFRRRPASPLHPDAAEARPPDGAAAFAELFPDGFDPAALALLTARFAEGRTVEELGRAAGLPGSTAKKLHRELLTRVPVTRP